jgi:trans-aconitate methyltransferase
VNRKQHWNRIYRERKPEGVSWFQEEPAKSLELVRFTGVSKDSAIIDVGGGASVLADRLLDSGFTNLTVLDISAEALSFARKRLGEKASRVRWIEADITQFKSVIQYDLWHDRAVFHFLTEAADREKYVSLLQQSLHPGGYLVLAAFALDGPDKCSGLSVRRYDSALIRSELGSEFTLVREDAESHMTPSNKEQEFRYFVFRQNQA